MVVDQANIAGGVRLLVVTENQPPVSGDNQTPQSSELDHVIFAEEYHSSVSEELLVGMLYIRA
jgi:hypothetical protein